MVVTEKTFDDLIQDLQTSTHIGYDTETRGLRYHDRLFSLAIATGNDSYYLNFNYEADHSGVYPKIVLPIELLKFLEFAFEDTRKTWFAHNAGFDNQKIALEGVKPPQNIHCTYVAERLVRNDSLDLSLDAVARKYGYAKDKSVEEYIKEFKLYTQVQLPGKERKDKVLHYDQVPFELISIYGETDAQITRLIGIAQLNQHFGVHQ
jgi:hypothetical protein